MPSGKANMVFAGRCILCFIFFSAGLCKLIPTLSPDFSSQLDESFRKSFTPFWQARLFDRLNLGRVSPELFKQVVGSVEVASAVLLFTPLKRLAGLLLFVLMLGATYMHIDIDEPALFPGCLAGMSAICGLMRAGNGAVAPATVATTKGEVKKGKSASKKVQ